MHLWDYTSPSNVLFLGLRVNHRQLDLQGRQQEDSRE